MPRWETKLINEEKRINANTWVGCLSPALPKQHRNLPQIHRRGPRVPQPAQSWHRHLLYTYTKPAQLEVKVGLETHHFLCFHTLQAATSFNEELFSGWSDTKEMSSVPPRPSLPCSTKQSSGCPQNPFPLSVLSISCLCSCGFSMPAHLDKHRLLNWQVHKNPFSSVWDRCSTLSQKLQHST